MSRQSQAFLEPAGFVAAQSASFLESAKPVSLSHRDADVKEEEAVIEQWLV